MEKIFCGIYKITSPTGRIYIGSSKNIHSRWKSYKAKRRNGQVIIENSIMKHGWDAHNFEIVEECLEKDLFCRERHWQDFYDVLNGGLNCQLVGCGDKRAEWSEERRKKMSDRNKGAGNPMYGTSRIGHGKGRKASPEVRKHLSEIAKIRVPSKENLAKRSKSMIGKMVGDKNPMFSSIKGMEVKKISSNKTYENIKLCALDNELNYVMLTQHLKKKRNFGVRYEDYKLI